MNKKNNDVILCNLCREPFTLAEMSEEHYPARSVGNEDIVALDIITMFDMFQSKNLQYEITRGKKDGKTIKEIASDIFDRKLSNSLYPKGRTSRTLCRKCNTFLGKYEEAYLKFFKIDGKPSKLSGF